MKELLEQLAKGETTVDDVLKQIDESTKNMVPRSRLNEKTNELKQLQQQLDDRDVQLDTLSKQAQGNEELQNEIKKLQQQNEQTASELKAQLAQQAYDFALDKELLTAKARNPKAVKALLDMEAIKLDGESLLGLSEQLTKLQESDSYLFDVESGSQGGTGGYNPGSGQKTNPPPPPKDGVEAMKATYELLKQQNKLL